MTFERNEDLLGEHFSATEFGCFCGECGLGLDAMRPKLLRWLVDARTIAGVPFVLTSSIRCHLHNADVGGVDSSAHMDGYAVDVAATDGLQRYVIVRAGMAAGFTRIGVAGTFVHLDCDPSKPSQVIWTY